MVGCGKLNFSHDCDYYTVAASCCTHRKSVCFLCKHTRLLAHFMWYRRNTGKTLFDAMCQLHPWYIWLLFYMMTLYLHIKQFICLRREKTLLIPSKHMELPSDICHIWNEWIPQSHCCANLKTQFHVNVWTLHWFRSFLALQYIRSCTQISVRVGLKEGSVPLKIHMFQTSGEFLNKLSVH